MNFIKTTLTPMVRLGAVATVQSGLTLDAGRQIDHTTVSRPYLRVANVQNGWLDLSDVKEVKVPWMLARRCELQPGDVLMTEGGDPDKLGRGAVWQGEIPECLHQNHIFAVRPSAALLPSYLAFLMQSAYARAYFEATASKTTGIASTSVSKIASFRIPLPKLEDQIRIADFLDTRTTRIDTLIARKHRLIVLFTERMRAITDKYVEGPEARIAVRHIATRITSGPRGWADLVADAGKLFLRITNIQRDNVELDLRDGMFINAPNSAEAARTRVLSGDVLVSITADIGSVGIARREHEGAHVSQHIALITPSGCEPEWLAYSLRGSTAQAWLDSGRYGGTKAQLALEDVGSTPIWIPSRDEQKRRLATLKQQLRYARETSLAIKRQVTLLQEHRQALITAAVTGQLDVARRRAG